MSPKWGRGQECVGNTNPRTETEKKIWDALALEKLIGAASIPQDLCREHFLRPKFLFGWSQNGS